MFVEPDVDTIKVAAAASLGLLADFGAIGALVCPAFGFDGGRNAFSTALLEVQQRLPLQSVARASIMALLTPDNLTHTSNRMLRDCVIADCFMYVVIYSFSKNLR